MGSRIKQSNHSDGNVLFLILIAVALFAALSYAVTSTQRGTQPDISEDKIASEVSGLLTFTASLRTASQRAAFNAGVSGDQVLYNNDIYASNNGSRFLVMGTPANPALYVFHPQGGNLSPITFTNISYICSSSNCTTSGFTKPGHLRFLNVNIPGVGSSEPDVALIFPAMTAEACKYVNKVLGLGFSGVGFPNAYVDNTAYQNTTAAVAPGVPDPADAFGNASKIFGKYEFCYKLVNSGGSGTASSTQYFLSVIWPR